MIFDNSRSCSSVDENITKVLKMKVLYYSILALSCYSVSAFKRDVSVFELTNDVEFTSSESPVGERSALLYLSDMLDISGLYNLGSSDEEAIALLNARRKVENSKPEVLLMVDGVSVPETFFRGQKASFSVDCQKPNTLRKLLFESFPNQLRKSTKGVQQYLTKEIKLVSKEKSSLIGHFAQFEERLFTLWKNYRGVAVDYPANSYGVYGKDKVEINNEKIPEASLKLINDRLFINELSQIIHLNSVELPNQDKLFIKLDSLLSIASNVGVESNSYEIASKVLSENIARLSEKYDVTALIFPYSSKLKKDLKHLSKRSNEIGAHFAKRSTGSCFTTEESCNASTDNCGSHGSCKQLKSDCWACACVPSYDKKLKKTTNWSGFDCTKKDVSVEANLFLWFSIALIIFIIGGIKLMFNVGSEPLPDILDAATAAKKNQ